MSNFRTPPPPFLTVRMGPNWARPPLHWSSKLRLPPTPLRPHTHSLWYSCSKSIKFSRRFPHILCPCNSQLFITKNQFESSKHISLGMLKIKPKCCLKPNFHQTRHLSGTLKAEPDACLDSNDTYTNYICGHPVTVDPLPLPCLTIHCHLNFDQFLPDPPPLIYWMS